MPAKYTPGPWIDSPEACDAVINTDSSAIQAELEAGGPFTQEALDYYGGYVICESVAPNNKPLIKAAPALYAWAKLWLEAIQKSVALRATLANLPCEAGSHMVNMLSKAIDLAEEESDV